MDNSLILLLHGRIDGIPLIRKLRKGILKRIVAMYNKHYSSTVRTKRRDKKAFNLRRLAVLQLD